MFHFLETAIFTRLATAQLSPEEYRALQLALLLRPDQGKVIAGTHGLRKLRWGAAGHGKRGALRVMYYWRRADQMIYLLYLYAKKDQGDLTSAQAKALAQVGKEEFE